MSLPTSSDVHVDAALSDYAVAYGQDNPSAVDIGTTVKKVDKQSDKYFIWTKGDIFRSEMTVRADGGLAKEAGFNVSTTSYFAEVYALKTKVTQRQRKNADFDLEKAKTRYLMQQAQLKRDLIMATNVFGTGLWTSNTEQTGVTGSSPSTNQFQYFNESGSLPIKVIQDQMLAIQASTSKMPNTAYMTRQVLQTLQRHADVTELTKYTQSGIPGEDLVASIFGLDKIVVLDTVQNTGNEAGTVSMSRVWGKHILLAYIAPGPSTEDATAITSFLWNEVDGVDASGAAIRTWYDNDRKCDWYEAEMGFDCKLTANDLGVFLLGVIA